MSHPKSLTQAANPSHAEWVAEGVRRFGPNSLDWVFVCPACGHEQSSRQCAEAGMPENAVAFSCIGRYLSGSRKWLGGEGPGPCNYTGGGLFAINPIRVSFNAGIQSSFAFAEPKKAGSPATVGGAA